MKKVIIDAKEKFYTYVPEDEHEAVYVRITACTKKGTYRVVIPSYIYNILRTPEISFIFSGIFYYIYAQIYLKYAIFRHGEKIEGEVCR